MGWVEKILGPDVGLVSTSDGARAASADELLEKGIYTQETKGEVKTAIQICQEIVDDPRPTAAWWRSCGWGCAN